MLLEVNGIEYDYWVDAAVDIRMDALCRHFSFTSAQLTGQALPFKGGEPCRVLDGSDVLMTGYIEKVDVTYSGNSHRVALSGRDKTGDLVDSTLRAVGDYNPPISLKRVIELAIADIGADIGVVDQVQPAQFKKSADIVAPEPAQNAFEFIEKLARKRQVLLSSDGDGNVTIIQGTTTERSAGALQNKIGADDNNVKSARASYDLSGRFRNYTSASSMNPLALASAGATAPTDVVNQKGSATDADIRVGRQMIVQGESPMSASDNNPRAQWEANIRKIRGQSYSVVVQGFRETADGALWGVNRLVSVVDDFAGIAGDQHIAGDMLISAVSFSLSDQNGSETALTLVPPNAYSLERNL